jgi:hypothetical protein
MKSRGLWLLASLGFTPSSLSTKVTRNLANDNQTLGTETQDSCGVNKIKRDAYSHKDKYLVGVHDTHGLNNTMHEYNLIFGEYLTATAGQKFDPPVTFEVVPSAFEVIFTAAENKELDFMFANSGIYSCVGTQIGATALATVSEHGAWDIPNE